VENRLIEAENGAWGTSTYLYDPPGQRKQKTVGINTTAPVATDFVLAGGEEIADYSESSATWRLTVRGADGLPLVTVVPATGGGSEEVVYVHHDMKGWTVALTVSGSTGLADTYTYSDYGSPQSGTWLDLSRRMSPMACRNGDRYPRSDTTVAGASVVCPRPNRKRSCSVEGSVPL